MQDKSPHFIFLVETKANDARLDLVRRTLRFLDCFTFNFLGRRGRLTLLCEQDMKVDIVNFSKWHISTWMELGVSPPKWLFTDFYGKLDTNKQNLSCNMLNEFKLQTNIP